MVKKIKSHKDVKLPFGSGKTDTRPWVPREKAGKGGKYVPPTPEQSKEIRDILKKLQGGKKTKKHQDRPEDGSSRLKVNA